MEVFGCNILRASLKDIFAESIYHVDSRIILVPLNEHEQKCWLPLAKFRQDHVAFFYGNKRCHEIGEESVGLDNPFVPVISDFAVDTFNDLCRMMLNTRLTVMDISSITLEAMAEDVAGVYETTVLCHYEDGRRTLLKFNRLPHLSVGEKFKDMAALVSEKSRYEAVKELKTATKAHLKRCNFMKGKKKSAEFIRLKKDYQTVKGALRCFDKHPNPVNLISWKIKKTNPDNWFVPNKITGLLARSDEHVCGGYDYHNPMKVFSCFTSLMPFKSPK